MFISHVKRTLRHLHLREVECSPVVARTSMGEIFVGCESADGTLCRGPP